jgi:predicted amidohydrolase YtcJ
MSGNGGADLAFVGGPVYTVDAARTWARAVAVKDGRIVAVGSDEDVRPHVDAHTELIDLEGRLLLPGFQDAHAHPVASGVEMLRCDLTNAYSIEEYERIIRSFIEIHPDDTWLLGSGWSMDVFPGGRPSKELLDALEPDRPAYFPSRDGHSAWVNSRALELAGITAETPDPPDGRIERGEGGEPQGTLQEGAMYAVSAIAPVETSELRAEGLRVAQRYLNGLGITAWQDAIVDVDLLYRSYGTYVDAASRGELSARVVGALWWQRHLGLEQVDELLELRANGHVGRFRATSVKIMQDGVVENGTAATMTPYFDGNGHPTENTGISFVEPGFLKEVVTRLDAEGFQVHFHALADRAVREALDAIEVARAVNGPSDRRHHLAHIQVIHPDDVPRFRELDVVANGQPLWAMLEGQMVHLTIPFLGPDRSRWQYPFGSLQRAGATLAFGSDWSVSSPDPFEEMHVAVNRTEPSNYAYASADDPMEPFLPDERIDLPSAVAAFTIGTAYVNHLDHETGSIEAGKLADLVVVDRDIFAEPADAIADAKVAFTFLEGEKVYEADGAV